MAKYTVELKRRRYPNDQGLSFKESFYHEGNERR